MHLYFVAHYDLGSREHITDYLEENDEISIS